MEVNKKISLDELINIVRGLFINFNNRYGNIINNKKIDDAISNIVITNGSFSNVPKAVKDTFIHGAKGVFFEDQIYVTEGVEVETLFHEMLHYISKDSLGIKIPIYNAYSLLEAEEEVKKYGEGRFLRQVIELDESFTRFITELAIPDVSIEDAYKYGAELVKQYYDGLIAKGIDASFVLNMYFNGSDEDALKFKNSFGTNFSKLIEFIERINNVRFYILKQPKDKSITPDEASKIVDDAISKIAVR